MPYNGPSKGCKTCLRRKIKCDEGKPFCNNCAKSKGKYTCEGYRERSDLIFRDDTESAKTRAHKKAAVPVGEVQLPAPEEKIQDYYAHTDLSAGPIAPDYATTTTAATLQPQLHGTTPGTWIQGEASNAMTVVRGPVQQLQTQPQQQLQYVWNTGPPMTGLQPQNLEDQAVGVFFQDYAWAPKTYVFSLDFLPNEYGRAKRRNCMTSATEAVALAHLANKRNDAAALELASKRYIVAIRATNKALRNSSEALKDETMMAVHLLILYEVSGHYHLASKPLILRLSFRLIVFRRRNRNLTYHLEHKHFNIRLEGEDFTFLLDIPSQWGYQSCIAARASSITERHRSRDVSRTNI
ncbi:hypothetical protein M501DRAFT_225345 [Patellaria atrata CBS 101060]|uniref:Zn(2)-C6 fungal-type domain-containing protein n=1 Tax=Patellaria atrata CBS 101060 TaxID=1346257 RepID=A0A9P4S6P8_9PEZI|nr:hypothetical protein M501DRAFT_225345 [Patellaria atrata CBS 101060]